MAIDKSEIGPANPNLVDVTLYYDICYWTVQLKCTPNQLRAAVAAAGKSAVAVREYAAPQPGWAAQGCAAKGPQIPAAQYVMWSPISCSVGSSVGHKAVFAIIRCTSKVCEPRSTVNRPCTGVWVAFQ